MSLRTVLDVVYKTMTDSIDLWSPPARPIFSQNLLIIFAVFCFTYDIYIYIYIYMDRYFLQCADIKTKQKIIKLSNTFVMDKQRQLALFTGT